METQLDLAPLPNGLGLQMTVDGTRSLPELTEAVNGICEGVERLDNGSVAVLRLDPSATQRREWPGHVGIQAVNRWERAVRRLERMGSVSIAVAGGTCGGPALDLLLAADFRIGTPDLRLVLPVNDGHFWPGMALFRLVQQVGLAHARQAVLWGTDMPLATACGLGLIDRVSDDPDEATRTAAVLVGRISDRETAVRRQLLLEAGAAQYEDALGLHLAACDRELRRLRAPGAEEGA